MAQPFTQTNPEGIISAPKRALFFRRNTEFFINQEGRIDGTWTPLANTTVIAPPLPDTIPANYQRRFELWLKASDGFKDFTGEIKRNTGWRFLGHFNVMPGVLNWIFPVPTHSFDPTGNDNSRSYDENFFYAKVDGIWLRTPILSFCAPGISSKTKPDLHSILPFIDDPRALPVPRFSGDGVVDSVPGEQSYDRDFFYIRTPTEWRRVLLTVFSPCPKMARF